MAVMPLGVVTPPFQFQVAVGDACEGNGVLCIEKMMKK